MALAACSAETSMAKSYGKSKGRRESGGFVLLPHALLNHPDFISLTPTGLRVLLWLAKHFNGRNNGDLSVTAGQVKTFGIGSSASLSRALAELQEKRWIVCTRTGRFMKPGGRCSLYGLTWLPIDDCPGKDLEHPPTTAPIRSLSLEKRAKNPV